MVYTLEHKLKNMKRIIVLIVLVIGFISCEQTPIKPTQMQKVVATHDEVMPKMSTITQLIRVLETKIDSTNTKKEYQIARDDLQASYKLMMDWMTNFGERFTHDEIMKGAVLSEEKKQWLNEESIKVEKMKSQILTSIKNAETLLNE